MIHNELRRKTQNYLLRKGKNSEKRVEPRLVKGVKLRGGNAVKFFSKADTGWMDRWVLFKGLIFFCECKTQGKVPDPVQVSKREWLEENGFQVFVVDTQEKVDGFLKMLDML